MKKIGILTYRRAEILKMDAFGYSQEEISRMLRISQPRVSIALRTAKEKIAQAKATIEFYEEVKHLGSLIEAGFKGDVVIK
jgi:transcriptional regulator